MAVRNQKLKILYLMEILMNQTDETHIMTAQELCKALDNQYGIPSERKSIYHDIETLQEFGMDIVQSKGKSPGYYVASRQFELPELKLLVDAVQASKFITSKKSEELIRKLESLASKSDAEQLQRQVFIYNRPKAGNETIYYNVDKIHMAIYRNQKISFQYAEWTIKKELRLKKEGAHYIVNPWALTWDDENYYLVAYEEEGDCIKHYRVDKIQKMEILEERRTGKEVFQKFDLATFAKKTFGMYGGRDESVSLCCQNELVGVVLDRFGKDVMMIPQGENQFHVTVEVAISQQFFGWVTGIGKKMKILSPKRVQDEYYAYLQDIIKNRK